MHMKTSQAGGDYDFLKLLGYLKLIFIDLILSTFIK